MNFSNELYHFFLDLIYLISPKRKALLSYFSIFFKLNKLRIILYRSPFLVFNLINKNNINFLKSKNNFAQIDPNLEYAVGKIKIKDSLFEEIENLTFNQKNSNGGAIPYKKGGVEDIKINPKKYKAENKVIEGNNKNIILKKLFTKKQLKEFVNISSVLLGYKIFIEDINMTLIKTKGENSNSYWHSDCYYPILKTFIYLVDVTHKDAPFEFAKGTTDLSYLERIHNKSSLNNQKRLSPRLVTKEQLVEINKKQILTHIGTKGSFLICNTSGMHRKGLDLSGKERIILGMEFKRIHLWKRLLRSFIKLHI